MAEERKVTYGDLAFAKRVNEFKKFVRPTYFIVIAPQPTKFLNPNFIGYHWIRYTGASHSFFNEIGTIESILVQCEQENWNLIICGPSRAISYALSRVCEMTDSTNETKTLREILNEVPAQFKDIPRNLYLELGLYREWTLDDETCTDIVNACTDKRNAFKLEKLLRMDFRRLAELEETLEWREAEEAEPVDDGELQ